MSDTTPPRRSLLGALRASFLTGLVVVLPTGLTLWLIWSVIGWLPCCRATLIVAQSAPRFCGGTGQRPSLDVDPELRRE